MTAEIQANHNLDLSGLYSELCRLSFIHVHTESYLRMFYGTSSKTQLMERDVQTSETVSYCI